MARLARLYIPNEVQHVILDAIHEVSVFPTEYDIETFYNLLMANAKANDLKIHAYSLLPQRVQLLVTPSNEHSIPKTIQSTGRVYVAKYNRIYSRRGTLWQGRYRATVIDAAEWFLPCSVMIDTASEGPSWHPGSTATNHPLASSLRHNLGISNDPNLANHDIYWDLGNTPFARHAAYAKLVEIGVSAAQAQTLQKTTQHGWVLGGEEFRTRVARVSNRRITQLSRGRPRKDGLPVGTVLAKA